jgi:very-short-patch-repair endonuclease
MESDARLVFIDGGLPHPELQYWIRDLRGQHWRVDFAWPESKLVAEYDSVDWHRDKEVFLTDRLKYGRLQDCGWSIVSMTVDDVRHRSRDLVARINGQLECARLTG